MRRRVRGLVLVACAVLLAAGVGRADSPGDQAPQPQHRSGSGTFSLTVIRDAELSITLTADDARLSDVAARLARQLGVPISVSQAAANDLVSASFSDMPFETALTLLAPRAYVDYELRPGKAVPLEVRLATSDDPPPAPRFPAMGILVEGNTEDVSQRSAPDPLRLSYEDNRLSIEVDRQPLGVVVAAVAETLDVPYDIQLEDGAAEIVDVAVIGASPEVALLRLSPNMRVNVRADLYRGDRVVQRIVVASPSAP